MLTAMRFFILCKRLEILHNLENIKFTWKLWMLFIPLRKLISL